MTPSVVRLISILYVKSWLYFRHFMNKTAYHLGSHPQQFNLGCFKRLVTKAVIKKQALGTYNPLPLFVCRVNLKRK